MTGGTGACTVNVPVMLEPTPFVSVERIVNL